MDHRDWGHFWTGVYATLAVVMFVVVSVTVGFGFAAVVAAVIAGLGWATLKTWDADRA